jgi:hypothetical protein
MSSKLTFPLKFRLPDKYKKVGWKKIVAVIVVLAVLSVVGFFIGKHIQKKMEEKNALSYINALHDSMGRENYNPDSFQRCGCGPGGNQLFGPNKHVSSCNAVYGPGVL